MIAVDTNVVVRLLVQDDRDQLERALAVLEPHWESGGTVFLADIVLAELEWVLESAYRVPRAEMLSSLHALVSDRRFAVEDKPRALEALRRFQSGKGDLADYLIGLAAKARGSAPTLTFDRSLRGEPAFHVI